MSIFTIYGNNREKMYVIMNNNRKAVKNFGKSKGLTGME